MPDQLDLDGWDALAAAATPGPWRWAYPGSDSPELVGIAGDENYSYEVEVIEARHDGGCGCRSACTLTVEMNDADAEFIATAREAMPALIAEVRRLQRVEKALRHLHRHGQTSSQHRCRTGAFKPINDRGIRTWVEEDCPTLAALAAGGSDV